MTWGNGSPPISAAEAPSGIQWKSLGPSVATTALATFVVAVRFYTRVMVVRAVGRDDGVVLFSLILSIAMCAIVGAEVAVGSNPKYHVQRPEKIWVIAKLVIANNCLYAAITNLTKASILLQYLRVFSSRPIRWICWILMILCSIAALWAIFGGIFLCTPVGKLWQPDIPGWCMNAEHYWVSTAAINVILDFSVLILPMPTMITINLPKRQKTALLLVFLLGGFGSIVSLVRLLVVHLQARQGHYMESGIAAVTWSAVEANTGIICASLMALKPLLVHFFPHLMLSNQPARCAMRLDTIPYDSTGTYNMSHRTLVNTIRNSTISQRTVVPEMADATPSARTSKKISRAGNETPDANDRTVEDPETRARWRVSKYGWPPGTAL